MKKNKYFCGRVLFACLMLMYLFFKADLGHVSLILSDIRYEHILYASIWVVLIRVFMTLRWQILLKFRSIAVDFLPLLKITWISMFLGHFFPGGIGPDVVRGYALYKKGECAVEVTGSLIWDRIFGVYSMMMLASLALIFGNPGVFLPSEIVYGTQTLFLISTSLILLWPVCIRFKWVTLEAGRFQWMQKWVRPFNDPVGVRHIIVPSFGLSLVVQVLRCLLFYSLYNAFGANVPFSFYVVVIPIVYMIVLIPVSISGLGVREGTLIYFFNMVHLNSEISLTVGLLSHFIQMMLSLPGCLFWLWDGKKGTYEKN